jgi:internalin A
MCKKSQNPHFYKFEQLRKLVSNNITDTRCDESLLTVNVLSLIDDVFGREKFLKSEKNRDESSILIDGNSGTIIIQQTKQGDNTMSENNSNPQSIKVKSAWFNGSFYLFVVSIIFGIITFTGKQISLLVLILGILGTAILTLIIGLLQLKQDDRLKDESFIVLIKMVIGSLPLIGNPLRKLLTPADKSKDQE